MTVNKVYHAEKVDKTYKKICSALMLAVIVVVGMCYCMWATGIYPFGQKSNLFSDLATQYVSFLVFFRESTLAEKVFSLTKGFGGQTLGLLSYYAFSPFNLITYLFSRDNIETALFVIIVARAVFMAENMLCYLNRHYKNSTANMAFALMYAFFPYFTRYYYNILWMDCFAVLPLLILGTERIMDGKSGKLFVFAYVYSLVSNYYIAYMSSLFVLLWFMYYFAVTNSWNIKIFFAKAIKMAEYAIAGLMFSAPVLLPSFYLLRQGKFNDTTISSWRLIKRFNWGTFPASFFEGMLVHEFTPHLVGTIVCFFLIAALFLNSDISKKEKLASALLLGFMVLSVTTRPLGYVWHGFSAPQGFHHRQTFVYAFTLIALCRKSLEKIEYKGALKSLIMLAPAFAFAGYYYTLDLAFAWRENIMLPTLLSIAVCTAAFITVKYRKKTAIFLLSAYICFISVYVGGFHMAAQYRNDVDGAVAPDAGRFRSSYTVTDTALSAISDDGFYRAEDTSPWSQNQAMVHGYNSISHYSSVFESLRKETAIYFGLPDAYYSTTYTLPNPLRDSVLGIKYIISPDKSAADGIYSCIYNGEKSVYCNPFSFPLIYTGRTNTVQQGTRWEETVNNMTIAVSGIPVLNAEGETDYTNLSAVAEVLSRKEGTLNVNNGMFLSFTLPQSSDGYMLSSLLYDDSWHIKVNGKTVKQQPYMTYFMSVPVEQGVRNTVEMVYIPQGLLPGLLLMAAAAVLTAIHYIHKRKTNTTSRRKEYVH